MAQGFEDQRGKGRDHNPDAMTFTCPKVVYRNTGISATVMARAWITDMPSVLRNAMAGPAPRARALGAKSFQGEVFNWLLAGSQAPTTSRKDRDAHTRGSLHRAERQTTKSATEARACEHRERQARVPWRTRREQSLRQECPCLDRGPHLLRLPAGRPPNAPRDPLCTLSLGSRGQCLWHAGPRADPEPGSGWVALRLGPLYHTFSMVLNPWPMC